MGGCIKVALLIGCLTAQLAAQAPGGQTDPKAVPAATEAAPAMSGKVEYPLDAFRDFSAIMVGSRSGIGGNSSEAYIYRSGDLMRVSGPEGRGYFITNLKTLETYGITANPCAFSKHPYLGTSPFPAATEGSTVERVPAGTETFDGRSCHRSDVTVSSPKPGAKPIKMRLWEADDLQGFPVKIEFPYPGGKTAIVLYKNVRLGPQDPTLFIHPKNCSSLEDLEKREKPEKMGKSKSKAPSSPAQ